MFRHVPCAFSAMPNNNQPSDSLSSAFPESRRDGSNLKQTAVDAAKDLTSTATAHVSKARGQIQDLAGHAQDEAYAQVDQVKGKVSDLAEAARAYVLARPLASLATALTVGFLFGLSRRGSRN
jgi:ElaB/YqjD/DUF883 family membrane-anchored ribosome-binding protein